MKILSVIGVSNSGKTTTIEKIVGELLRRSYTVGTVKNIHCPHFAMDVEGTDTDRHKKAGSQMVVAWGLCETDILIPKRLDIEEILGCFKHDFVIIEGMRECRYPKIVTARSLEEIEMMLDPTVFSVSGVIGNTLTEYKHLPVINSLTKAELLVDLIERKFLSPISSVTYDVYAEEKENGAV
ncbi:MAG: molybdopterin-guanine dinucleotide biosynthesis protein B [Dethiobacteria bacterium]|nr:molybdopterin-guanine dinucleotide biosynthesis protein B [Bacillota bacterium]